MGQLLERGDQEDDDDTRVGCFQMRRRKRRKNASLAVSMGGSERVRVLGAREGKVFISLGIKSGGQVPQVGILDAGDAGGRLVQWMTFMADHKITAKP